MLFNADMTAYRCRPEKAYGEYEYFKNGGADEIIFVFKGGGTLETVFGQAALSRGRLHRHSARHHLSARAG